MTDKLKEKVDAYEKAVQESRQTSPQAMVKRALAVLEGQMRELETLAAEGLLDASGTRTLSSHIESLIKISKEYRDGDIDPLEQFRNLSPEEEDEFILELARRKGLIKDGTVVYYYNEKESNKEKRNTGDKL